MENRRESVDNRDEVVRWLTSHGDVLYRYALRRVGKSETAEDLVQETFLAALRSADGFEGRSEVRTWLVGILRNKVADHLRKMIREREREADAEAISRSGGAFHNGHWRIGLKRWSAGPSTWMEDQEFWQVLDTCHAKLPTKLAIAFRMRDLEELSMADICDILEITSTNLSVRLHRARVLLRECLDQNWFSARRKS